MENVRGPKDDVYSQVQAYMYGQVYAYVYHGVQMYAYCQVNQYSCVLQVTGLFVLPGTDVCVLPCIHICEPSGTARYTCMYVYCKVQAHIFAKHRIICTCVYYQV